MLFSSSPILEHVGYFSFFLPLHRSKRTKGDDSCVIRTNASLQSLQSTREGRTSNERNFGNNTNEKKGNAAFPLVQTRTKLVRPWSNTMTALDHPHSIFIFMQANLYLEWTKNCSSFSLFFYPTKAEWISRRVRHHVFWRPRPLPTHRQVRLSFQLSKVPRCWVKVLWIPYVLVMQPCRKCVRLPPLQPQRPTPRINNQQFSSWIVIRSNRNLNSNEPSLWIVFSSRIIIPRRQQLSMDKMPSIWRHWSAVWTR